MRLGFSYWGVLADFEQHRFIDVDTPDGHRYGRPIFVRELLSRGHQVVALQQRREPEPYVVRSGPPSYGSRSVQYPLEGTGGPGGYCKVEEFPELDALFLEWRWPTWKNDSSDPQHQPERYEPDLDRQRRILEHYRGRVPIVLWDTDLKVTREDEEAWPEAIVADPTFDGNRLTRDRVSIPFWTDWKELFPVEEPYPVYGYIGNRYERELEFGRYYYYPATVLRKYGIQTTMHGNWLRRSPERSSPSDLIQSTRDVAFGHRMNFYDSMKLMGRFACTTHVSKDLYYRAGFVSPRYLEALAVGCPGLVPQGMWSEHGHLLGEQWSVFPGDRTAEAVDTIAELSLGGRKHLVESQREALKKFGKFDVARVVDYLESLV